MLKKNIEGHASHLSGKSLLLIGAATIAVRLTVMILLRSWEFNDDWAFGHEMGRMGQWIGSGNGFSLDGKSPTARFPPFYPLVVAGFFTLFGAYSKTAAVGLFLFQSACAAVSALCLAVLGNRLFNGTVGLVAGLVMAIYPTSIFYSAVHIWYSELAVMLALLLMTIAVAAKSPPTRSRIAFLGGLSGLIVLTDPTMGLYLPLLLLWILFAWRVKLPRFVVLVVAWGIIAAVVVSPWVVRNWFVLGSPILVKSNLGLELWTGNRSLSSGTDESIGATRTFGALDKEEREYYKGQSEIVHYRYLQQKTFELILAHPFQFVRLTGKRMWYFWVVSPNLGRKSWVHLAYFGPLVILAVYGLWLGLRRGGGLAPVWLFLVVYPLPYYVTHVYHGRYIYPVEPMVVLLAALPLSTLIGPAVCRVFSWEGVFHVPPSSTLAGARIQGPPT